MTLQECYVKIGGDYNDILHRFMNENMVRKFVLKFPQDNNMALFEESWAKKDYETAFRAMHTLKGVSVNLGFTALYNVSSALTEKLRSQEYDNLDGLIADVKKQYDIVIESICGTLLSRIILRIAGVIVMISNTGTCFPSTVGTSCCEITACNTMDS